MLGTECGRLLTPNERAERDRSPDPQGQGPNTAEQESSKHDRPPLVENSDGVMGLFLVDQKLPCDPGRPALLMEW